MTRPDQSSLRCRLCNLLLAFVCLSAAAMKFTNEFPSPSTLLLGGSSVFWNVLAIAIESLLGIWLLIGFAPASSWLLSLFLFSVFSVLQLLNLAGNVECCGCLGNAKVSTNAMLAIDVSVILLCLLGLSKRYFQRKMFFAHALTFTVFALIAFAAVSVWNIYTKQHDDSNERSWATIHGLSVFPESNPAVFESGVIGETVKGTISILNNGNDSIQISGMTRDCNFYCNEQLPFFIAPKSKRDVSVSLIVPNQTGRFTKRITVYASSQTSTSIPIDLVSSSLGARMTFEPGSLNNLLKE